MIGQLKTGLLLLLSVIIIAGIGLYTFRHSLLEALIDDQLRKQSLPLQSLAIEEFSFNALRLHNLAAGHKQELRVDKVWVTWQLRDLLAGKPVSIEISGLNVALDLSEERPPADFLQSMTATPEKGISIPWLPDLSLKDSTIRLHSAAGDAAIALSGDIAQSQPGIQAIQFNAIVSGSLAQTRGVLAATLDTQGNMQGKFTVSEGILDIPEAKISAFAGEAVFALAALQLQHIRAEFVLSNVRLPGKESDKPVSGQNGNNPAALALRDAAIDRITFKGDIRGLPDAWTGEFDLNVDGGRLTTDSLSIQQLSVSMPGQVNLSQDSWRIGLRNPAQIIAGKIKSDYPVRFGNSAGFTISQADLEFARNPKGLTFTHDIAVIPADLVLYAKRAESPEIEMRVHPGKITLTGKRDTDENYQGQFALSDAAFLLPQSQLQLKGISATVHLNDAEIGNTADFAIDQLKHLAPEPLFAALSVSGNIRNTVFDGRPPVYALNVTGGVAGLRYLKITGKYAPESADGMLMGEIVPLSFSPHGLQPGALSPILAQLENVTGQISGNAQLKWSAKGVDSSRGAFTLQNVSFAREAAKIEDLNVALDLEGLVSPSSLPRQTITAKRIDFGVPLENLLISYQIESTDVSKIALEKAQFLMMDGTVSLAPTVINPIAKRSDLLIRISNIDLAAFFKLINIDGLAGNGHLDGQIPLTLEENQVIITNGHLAAKAPGVLRFKSEKASQLLADTGEEMNLLLQALQDFHYTELSLDLDKSSTHDLVVKLSLLGNNPKVKDGQAFRLNIKLETDIDKILQTINQGYNLSHEILRGSLRLY
jgi:hypothetical protein